MQTRPKSVVGGPGAGNSPLVRSLAFVNTDLSDNEPQLEKDIDAKFFRANDARSPELAPPQKKAPTFFYANGQQEESNLMPAAAPSPPLSAVSARSGRSQFFRANGAEIDDIPSLHSPPLIAPSPKPPEVETLQRTPAFFRPPSSESIHLSYRKGASQVIKPTNRANAIPLLSPTSFQSPPAHRRSGSAETPNSQPPSKSHNRTSSLNSIESLPASRKSSLAGIETTGYPAPSLLATTCHTANRSGNSTPSQRGSGASASAAAAAAIQDPPSLPVQASQHFHQPSSTPHSPTKPNPPLSELAANARRERKVLDLEISNSSLLAINRQLEREVRKQKAELRRFRRLTRAGRLSSRSILGVGPDGGEEGGGGEGDLSELDEGGELAGEGDGSGGEEDEEDEEEEEEEDDDSTDESAILSPGALAERDERMLAKDSRRLQLDLRRHRELLVDSQKMNQALKRCMAWTEEMIKDGKKALEYRVRVDEVQLGGRVLEPECVGGGEEDEEDEEQYRLVSAWSPTSFPRLEAGDDGTLGFGVVRNGSWQNEELGHGVEGPENGLADMAAV